MRSTVSYLLTHGCGEPIMSHPDYEQHAYHHGCLLILLRGIGPSKPRTLQKIFERVQKVNNVKITDSTGQVRDIWVRFVHEHPVENNDWGDFQTHRRLLGLITIGKFETQTELNELCRLHESLKVKYVNTLYDSRCLLFGPNATVKNVEDIVEDKDNVNDTATITIEHSITKLEQEFSRPSNFQSQSFFYRENDTCSDLEFNISEFINSLFWILESKRLERSREKYDKVQLLLAPFEKRDFIGLDLESRNNRKRSIGRVTKNLGDLTLQSGLVAESLNLFFSASEILRAISDSLWLGAADEGLCAASSILLYPHIRQTEGKAKNTQEQGTPHKDGEKKSFVVDDVRKSCVEQMSADSSTSSNSSSSSSVSSIITTSSSTSSSNSHNDNLPPNILSPDEIVNQYRKAIINYSKYRHAGIIETEAALKAARICIEQNQNRDVAMFLQNVLYINLNISEVERIKRFEILTELYQRIGYHRKASFCQRSASWRHVAQSNPNPDWSQSYRLMLESFSGHKLSLDPIEVIENNCGWPSIQIDLLQQLVIAARRLGHSALATRHMTFLLQTQWDNMTQYEQKEMAVQLQNLSAQCEGSPVPLVLENGIVIPPANLTDIPFCAQFQVKDLPSHLKPQKTIINKVDSGPFLFTPIHFSSMDRKVSKKDDSKIAFHWVQHDKSEVLLKLKNNLPFELTVNDMRLLTSGIVFEAFPQTIVLQPSVPTTITLHGTPIEHGKLEINGYSTHTLGVKSNCYLKDMRNRSFPPDYVIDVIPALPRINAQTSFPQTATFSTLSNSDSVITSASLTIYNGETCECLVTLKNESNIPIEFLETSIHSNLDAEHQSRIFIMNSDEIKSKLPILPNESMDFKIKIFGAAEFICAQNPATHGTSSSHSAGPPSVNMNHDGPQSLNYSTLSSGHMSLPSRMSSPTHTTTPRRNDLTASFRSNQSFGHSSLATLSFAPTGTGSVQQLEAQLRLRYSGGEAMRDGFCRQCAILFSLELLPSAQITNWDVLPAEIASQFYLVLDVSNLTAQEMSLNYTANKNILIEAKESCRIPVPVDRCSLEKILDSSNNNNSKNDDNHLVHNTLSVGELSERACSQHIAERVKLKWTLTGTETHGIASLKGISLSSSMVDLITVAPLQWTVSLNNNTVQPQSEVVCSAGDHVVMNVSVCNMSQAALRQLVLTVKFYQDYQNGFHNYHLETRVTTSGPSQKLINVLQKDEKANHECSVIFFTPGRFKADIQCRCLTMQQTPFMNHNQESGIFTNTNESCSDFQDSLHVWKFIPPIEITVIE